jgi:ABC-type transport system involved in cytochrome c biogenesis permease component
MKAIDMTTESSLPVTKLIPQSLLKEMRVHGWTWQACGAVLGLCCGIISPVIGSVLTAIAWFTGPKWHGLFLQRDGTVLLFLTIPLLIFGAHCLDLIEKEDKKARKPR